MTRSGGGSEAWSRQDLRRQTNALSYAMLNMHVSARIIRWRQILKQRRWPEWWDWELELIPHLLKRMEDRRFSEVDLRSMLSRASSYHRDVVPGRWVIEARHRRRRWEVIVEPDRIARVLVVVTAYPVEGV